MRARTVSALGIAAIVAIAALWFAGDSDLAAVRSVRADAPRASNDSKPEAATSAEPAADAPRTALPPAADVADGGLLVEVVFAADQRPVADAEVFVLPPSVHEGADAPGVKPIGRTGADGALRLPKPTA